MSQLGRTAAPARTRPRRNREDREDREDAAPLPQVSQQERRTHRAPAAEPDGPVEFLGARVNVMVTRITRQPALPGRANQR